MTTYKQLEREFKRKVKELQKKCKHKRTRWAKEWWALGHPTFHTVRYCLTCNKIVERKRRS